MPVGGEAAADAPGDNEEFTAWYQAEHPKVLAVLCALSSDPLRAKEAADEAFCRCYGRWRSVRARRSRAGWAYGMALASLRRAQWRRRLDSRWRRPVADGDGIAASLAPAYQDAAELLAPLSGRQRRAMALRYVAGLTDADIACALRVPRSTVTATLAQARRKLSSLSDLPAYLEGDSDR